MAVADQQGCHRACALETSADELAKTSGLLTLMGIKCNRANFLDSPNFIGPNCPNSDSKMSHFVGHVRLSQC